MYPGLGQSVFSQRQDKDQQSIGNLYGPSGAAAVAAQSNIYTGNIPAVSGLSTGIQGLSIHPGGARGLTNTQYVSRSNTAPGGFGGITGLTGISQLGAPSPPPTRGGMLPLGSGRTSLMSTGQGLSAPKPPSRPSSLSSAIGSALPMNPYGPLGRTVQGMMSPVSSGFGPVSSGFGPSSSGFGPSTSGFGPSTSGFGPSSSGFGPVASGFGPSSSGFGPSSSGFGPGPSGFAPGPSGFGPTTSKPSVSVPGFQMHSEDFPALPGTTSTKASSNDKSLSVGTTREGSEPSHDNKLLVMSSALPDPRSNLTYDPAPGANKERLSATTPIGPPKTSTRKSYQPTTVSIPPGMVQDQFGMMGLLTFIRGAENDPNLVALALGSDLTTLGLNLNSPGSLYNMFASPWADAPCRPQDVDYNVPQEYLIHPFIREKLAPIRLTRYSEDLLFYLYYCNGGDLMQVLAAAELYSRDWRYHKEERLWITRAPGMKPVKQEPLFEEGTYCYFDVNTWRKAHKEFHVEYDKLEDRPQMPPNIYGGHQGITLPAQI